MTDERIDNYVTGRMSDEERLAFEREIESDAALREEVSLHRDIVRAVRMKGAKQFLQSIEQEIRAEEQAAEAVRHHRTQVVRLVSYVAMAACLAVGVFHLHNAANYRSVGNNIIITEAEVRGGFDSGMIAAKIESKEFKTALAMIANEQSRLSAEDPLDAVDNMELEWYKAVTYMRMGRWVKARSVLKQLAASDNPYYKAKAQNALEQL